MKYYFPKQCSKPFLEFLLVQGGTDLDQLKLQVQIPEKVFSLIFLGFCEATDFFCWNHTHRECKIHFQESIQASFGLRHQISSACSRLIFYCFQHLLPHQVAILTTSCHARSYISLLLPISTSVFITHEKCPLSLPLAIQTYLLQDWLIPNTLTCCNSSFAYVHQQPCWHPA